MKWERIGGFGMLKEPYRVGKFIEPGGVKVKYGLWYERELIGYFQTCQRRLLIGDENGH